MNVDRGWFQSQEVGLGGRVTWGAVGFRMGYKIFGPKQRATLLYTVPVLIVYTDNTVHKKVTLPLPQPQGTKNPVCQCKY
jgi:hypothetical protein